MLTDQLELKISGDGDAQFNQVAFGPDQNAFGYLGDKPFGGACIEEQWTYEDMTNNVPKWDLRQFHAPCNQTCTWPQVVAFFNTVFPKHRVLNAVLVDDAGSFFPLGRGCAYFDLVSTGRLTLTGHEETSEGGQQPNGC